MDGVHIGDFRCADDVGNIEVAFAAARRTDAHGLVREAHVQRIAVRFGVNRHRGNPQLLAGADDPQRDFPAIGD
jgi:hypothetical protein